MCLAVPMKITKIEDDIAIAEYNGVETKVNITLTPDIQIDDRVLVHAGFIIEKLDEESADAIEETWKQYEASFE